MIYLDHAATCPMRKCALDQMTEALKNVYGNASPSYPPAQEAKAKLDQARSVLAETIGADWREIFFTSGGTEGDNWALTGAAETGAGACRERSRPGGKAERDGRPTNFISHGCGTGLWENPD